MTPPTRRRLPVLVAILGLAPLGLLAGCDDESSSASLPDVDTSAISSAPADATSQAFCAAYDLADDLDEDADAGDGELADDLRSSAASLSSVGTPDDMPGAARAGFVVYVTAAGTATPDEARAVVGAAADQVATALGVATDDAGSFAAFQAYVAGTCFTGS